MIDPTNDSTTGVKKRGPRYLAIAWFYDGRYAWGSSDDREKALQRCRRAARGDLGVKRSFRANVYDTGGNVVTFDNNVHVYDIIGRDITEIGEIVEVM